MSNTKEEVEFVWSGINKVELEKSEKSNSYEELHDQLEKIKRQLDELGQLENKVNRARKWKDISLDNRSCNVMDYSTQIKWHPNSFEVEVRWNESEQSDFETVETIDQAIQKMREVLTNHKKRQEDYINEAKQYLEVV